MTYVRKPPIHRFWKHVHKNPRTGCWDWTGCQLPAGYGRFLLDGFHMGLAHRFSYEHFVGEIPPGMQIDHLCRNTSCVNPEHLECVTSQINNQRSVPFRQHAATDDHCSNGHPWNIRNTYISPDGMRACRACRNESMIVYRIRCSHGQKENNDARG
jgi:hypothetical protein